MSAVAPIETAEVIQQVPGRDRSWIEAILETWGEWIWKNRDFEGYPTADSVASYIYGAGGGQAGHRIICRDPPKWITMTHVIVMMLPEHEGIAIFAKYVPGVDDDGRMLSIPARCILLGISEDAFWKRIQRATFRIWKWSLPRRR